MRPTKRRDGAARDDIVASIIVADEPAAKTNMLLEYLSGEMSAFSPSTVGNSNLDKEFNHKVSKRRSTLFIAVQVCDICCV
jgi:hypothetical protein